MPQLREKTITTNQEKYFDKNIFPAVNTSEYDKILAPDDDLRRAITANELKEKMRKAIYNFFENK